ncbi:hypothetical protein [Methylibium petroleiphilum]|uniref:Uncharacterized protein n=1 Tax=Methylibium petroleiphilum (strain ATCC BAA-1232 / LMG 22953 / PM1) TaxID=420662 RepID=A2SN78_METPP|nr:hypothetical protein [Methylibium petroleiphilum]ABM97017.1 hypothetical protein Mpe_B0242 [Methylibium petroleiphilum PM1]
MVGAVGSTARGRSVPLPPALDAARTFIREHIGACAGELVTWLTHGSEPGPTLREAAKLVALQLPEGANALQVVHRLTELAALSSVAELVAWREQFPRHAYRESDGRVLLDLSPPLAS